MYATEISQRMIEAVASKINAEAKSKGTPEWCPEYHSQAQIDHAIAHLNDLHDPDQKRLRRPLTQDESEFIQNERRICALDMRGYWAQKYAWLIDWDRKPVHFIPNPSQNIILDLWAEDERSGHASWNQNLKARRLGVSTAAELRVAHTFQFQMDANCVVASADPTKTLEMANTIKFCLDQQPWWLLPQGEPKIKSGIPIEFPDIRSRLTFQAGNQFTGIAQGSTPNCCHLSELCLWPNAEELIDMGLLPAILDTPNVFGMLESTAQGPGWWKRKWEQVKRDWDRGTGRIRPVFLPWFCGTEIYPTPAALLKNPIPEKWTPDDRTIAHAERARSYVLSNALLFEHLAKRDKDWQMPRAQMWWWENGYRSAKEEKTLNVFMAQYCTAPETPVLTLSGWVPADQITVGDRLVAIDEQAPARKWRKLKIATVTRAVAFTGDRIAVETSAGQIVVSRDHKFLARDPAQPVQQLHWIPADQLVRGMVLKYFVKPWKDASDSWLAGIIDGEGSLNTQVCKLTIAQNEGPVLNRLKRELTALGVSFTARLVDPKQSARCMVLSITRLCDIVLLLGRLKPTRLWPRLEELFQGHLGPGNKYDVVVHAVNSISSGDLVGLTTTEGTLITDGYISHNCGDDFECFQSNNIPIIDTEVLQGYRERTREPIGVYTIIGPDIPPALIIPRRYWDHSKPPIPIKTRDLTQKFDVKYQLIPLLFDGLPGSDWELKLYVWEWPEPGHSYGIGVDCSEGIGQDRSVMEVLREASPNREPGQVAEWASAYVTGFQLWPLVMAVSCLYSTYKASAGHRVQSRVAIETWTNGSATQNELQKRGWSNFHPWKYNDKRRPTKDRDANMIGVRTNQWFRAVMLDMLLTSLSEEAIDLPSPHLIEELTTLERAGDRRKPQAAPDCFDDRVMALGFPLFSLHMNKPPLKQYARKRVQYIPGGDQEVKPNYAIWQSEDQGRDIPNPALMRVQRVGGMRGQVELARVINSGMPRGFR